MRGAGRGRAGATLVLATLVGALVGLGALTSRPASAAEPASRWSGGQLQFVPLGATTLGTPDLGSYRGSLVVGPDGSGIGVVNVVGLEDYLLGISEVPPTWPTAALQAQAIAARTYATWSILTHKDGGGLNAQICATDSCQVYRGITRDSEPGDGAWMAAVRATSGQVLLYRNDVIDAVYGSSDGGSTSYGGVPWLPAINDPDDALSPEHQWSWNAPLSDLAGPLGVPDGWALTGVTTNGSNVEVGLTATDGSGRTVSDTLGSGRFHNLLNTRMGAPGGLPLPLPSWRFRVSTSGDRVMVQGWGFGNGIGMSQYGALGKADRGWSAYQILGAYYGPAQTSRLGSGQGPSRIRVALADGLSSTTIQANGPFLLEDGSGQVLASGGSGTWSVSEDSAGVAVAAPPGYQPDGAGASTVTPTTPATPTTTASTAALGVTAEPIGAIRERPDGAEVLGVPGHRRDPIWFASGALALVALLSVIGWMAARSRQLLRVTARSSISQA